MVVWKASFWGRFTQSFRLLWRTSMLPLLLVLCGALIVAALLALILLAPEYAAWMRVAMFVVEIGLLVFSFLSLSVVLSGLVVAAGGEGQVALGLVWSGAWRRLPLLANASFLLVLCLMPLVLAAGWVAVFYPLVVLLLIPFAIWLGVGLYTLPMVLMMENLNPWQSIQRAWVLSTGFGWRVLGNGLLTGLIFLLGCLFIFVVMQLMVVGGVTGVMEEVSHGGNVPSLTAMSAPFVVISLEIIFC